MKHIKECEYCSTPKEYPYKSKIRRFCGYTCARLGAPKKPAQKEEKECTQCHKKFELLSSVVRAREKKQPIKFCSNKCFGLSIKTAKKINCLFCNKEFETTRNKFCSTNCVHEYKKQSPPKPLKGFWYENGYRVLYRYQQKPIKEHIQIMEQHIGRKLKKDEVVHHINRIRDDNRLENLVLLSRGAHSKLHRILELKEGKKLFARDAIKMV